MTRLVSWGITFLISLALGMSLGFQHRAEQRVAELEQENGKLRHQAESVESLPNFPPGSHFVQEDYVLLPYDMPPPSLGFSPTRICVESDTPFQLSIHGPRGGYAHISYQR